MNIKISLSSIVGLLVAGIFPTIDACQSMVYLDKPGNNDPVFNECTEENIRPVLAAMAACVEKELIPPATRMLRGQDEEEQRALVTCAQCLSWEMLYNNRLYCESIGMSYCGRRNRDLTGSAEPSKRQLQSNGTIPDGMLEYKKTNTCRMIVNVVGAEARCGYNHVKAVYSNQCTIA
jgi:hypothetical protein